MDLLGVVRSCLRRWYVFFPILALTAYLASSQYQAAAPQYSAQTEVVVAPSQELIVARGQQSAGGDPVTTPFNGGSGQSTLAGLLATALNSRTINAQLFPEGGVALTATRDVDEDSTLVTIGVVTDDGATASAAITKLQAEANNVLGTLQTNAGAATNQLYAAVPGGVIDPPVEDYPDRIRAVVALALAGTLAAVVLSVVAQALGRNRRFQSDAPEKKSKAPKPPKEPRAPRQGRRSVQERQGGQRSREKTAATVHQTAPRSGSHQAKAPAAPYGSVVDLTGDPVRTRRS